jgi:hypothetical protein
LTALWFCVGWSCDSPKGGEEIKFEIPLETREKGYEIRLGFLRSYKGMGQFEAIGDDLTASGEAPVVKTFESLWAKRISIYQEERVFVSKGNCTLVVKTTDLAAGREGNKAKLLAVVAYKM